MEHLSRSPEETEALGRALAERLRNGGVVLLSGSLGAGKTLLAKAVFAGLGVDPTRVTSPTFTLINHYASEAAPGGPPLYHVDLYRLEGPRDLASIGLDEVLDSGGVVLIEWGEKLGVGSRVPALRVSIEDRGGEERLIRVEPD